MPRAIKVRWSRICINNKCFFYGPRLGALYFLPTEQSSEKLLLRVLGLRTFYFTDELSDPACYVLHDLTELKKNRASPVSGIWCFIYQFIHLSRHIIPFNIMLNGMTKIASIMRSVNQTYSPSEIGQILHAIEQRTGYQNCYPRSIITACLCTQSRLSWDVTIGILSPTRMMHAWCSTNGILPFEPSPEHYMYQPLVIFSKTYS